MFRKRSFSKLGVLKSLTDALRPKKSFHIGVVRPELTLAVDMMPLGVSPKSVIRTGDTEPTRNGVPYPVLDGDKRSLTRLREMDSKMLLCSGTGDGVGDGTGEYEYEASRGRHVDGGV